MTSTCIYTHTHTHTHTQFPDQFSIGNSDRDPSKINIDYLIIKGLQLEESRKIKKQEKVERRHRTKKRPETSEEHKSYDASHIKADAKTGNIE